MNKITKRLSTLGTLVMGGTAIQGCTTAMIDESTKNVAKDTTEVESTLAEYSGMSKSPVQARMASESYIVGKKYKTESRQILPAFFRERYSFNRVDPVTFHELISYINKETNVRIDLASDAIGYINSLSSGGSQDIEEFDVDEDIAPELLNNVADQYSGAGNGLVGSDLMFAVNFEGTLKEFLDYITGRVNLYWEWKNNRIEIFHTKEQTFIIDADASSISFEASVSSSQDSSGGGGAESSVSGGGSSSHSTSISNEMGSIFADIESIIQSLMSEYGKFSISKQLSTVTVTDTPANLKKIERYISSINESVNKQILMKMRVIEVESNDSGEYGINLNGQFGNSTQIEGSFTPNLGGLAEGAGVFSIANLAGAWGESSVLANALAQNTNASIVSETTIHTTNGRPVPFQVAEVIDYVKSQSTVAEEGITSTELEIGSLLSGITLNILPKVTSEGKISLMMAADMADGSIIGEAAIDGGSVQLPGRTIKNFVQRTTAKNGESIMLTGFERMQNDSNVQSLTEKTSWLLGGQKTGNKKRVMTIILLTPYIMKD